MRKLQLPVTLTGSAGCTKVTELAAELEAILLTETDRGHGLVHQGTVTCCHHVTTKAGVESWTVGLIGHIAAVVVGIASPAVGDAAAVGALELSVCVAFAGELIAGVAAVILPVTLPACVDAARAVCALELIRSARAHAVTFVEVVTTVVLTIAQPGLLNAQEVVALHLTGRTGDFVAVDLIGAVATVIVAITSVLRGNTLTVTTFYLVLSTAVGGAVDLVRTVAAVALRVAGPLVLDANAVVAPELVLTACGCLPFDDVTWFPLKILLALLVFGFSSCQHQEGK